MLGCECKIYCWQYTNNCGIPPIQNTQINHAEVKRCTLLVSCSTDLDYCVVFVDWFGIFCKHVHRTLIATERFTPDLPIVSFNFACLLARMVSTITAATYTSDLNWSQASFEITYHNKTSEQFLDGCFCIKNESVWEYCSRTLFMNNVHKDCSCIKNWLNDDQHWLYSKTLLLETSVI